MKTTIKLQLCLFLYGLCFPNLAMSNQWVLNEIYSNADGSIQYIELFTSVDEQHLIGGQAITSIDNDGVESKSFTVPTDINSATAGKFLLFATDGFENLNSGVSADYIIENNFLFTEGGVINFGINTDNFSYNASQLPKNGLQSLGRDLLASEPSPTNFNDDSTNIQITVNPTYYTETQQLLIPALSLANSSTVFHAVLSRNNSENIELSVVDFYAYEDGIVASENLSTFDGNRLNLVDLDVEGELFQIQMSVINDNPITLGKLVVNPINSEEELPVSCDIEDIDVIERIFKVSNGWAIPANLVFDGGPGKDGIPSIDNPSFVQISATPTLSSSKLIVGVKIGNDIRAYPHNILTWHEIVNDYIGVGADNQQVILSYCPLTGSSVLWKSFQDSSNKTFGVSGLLFNSNLILYDRETSSTWSQMYEVGINGSELLNVPEKIQLVETTWSTWKKMYPNTVVLSEETGFSRNYGVNPYGTYSTNNSLIFPAENSNDNRLHKKERVAGINVGTSSKVYVIDEFTNGVEVVNDMVAGLAVVAAVSAGNNFGVIYKRPVSDCEFLEFTPVQKKLPIVMEDNEGNQWDIFGTAVSGDRAGEQLEKTDSYIAYWFAWISFFPDTQIYDR